MGEKIYFTSVQTIYILDLDLEEKLKKNRFLRLPENTRKRIKANLFTLHFLKKSESQNFSQK